MATVKDLAAYVCDKLAGKVLIHRYDAYSTNSVYLKFDYGLGNSLRLSDHTGKAGLNYRFNIITTMKSLGIDTSGEYPRFYYPPDMVDQAIAARGRLGDYCVACVEAFDQGRPNPIHADDDRVVRCDCFRPIPEPEEEEQKEGEPT